MTTRHSKPCSITKCLVIPSSHHSLSCLEQTEDHCPKCLHLSFPFSCRRDKSFHEQNYCFQIWRLSWETNYLPTSILCNRTGNLEVLTWAERTVLPLCKLLLCMEYWRFNSTYSWLQLYIEVSSQLHALIALSLGSKSPAPTEMETSWALSRPGSFWKWKNILSPRKIKRPIHSRPAHSLSAISTTVSHACWRFKYNILCIYFCFDSCKLCS